MRDLEVLEADLTWTGSAFETGVRVAVRGGRIEAVGRLEQEPTRRLAGRALLPGIVNVHSHAFQRGLRGRGETFPRESGSFWSWREAMYALVGTLDRDRFFEVTRRCYAEMVSRGITTVGEFHYLHHGPDGADFAFDEVVLTAARAVGIRLVLLNAYYHTGAIGRPLEGAQRRFDTVSPAAYWDQMDRLTAALDPDTQRLGAVVHSVRAADPSDLAAVLAEATQRGMVFHIHVEEQRREIEECRVAHGVTPMRLLLGHSRSLDTVTAVHCTHTSDDDMAAFVGGGGRVCVCPLTEANLGDGIPRVDRLTGRERLCLGTDSNARIDPTEEMRWLEYGQRLASERRGIIRDEAGNVAATLLRAATLNGAAALGLQAGAIDTGLAADFCTLDLSAPALAGWDAASLLPAFVFGADASVLAEVCVAGRWRRTDGAADG